MKIFNLYQMYNGCKIFKNSFVNIEILKKAFKKTYKSQNLHSMEDVKKEQYIDCYAYEEVEVIESGEEEAIEGGLENVESIRQEIKVKYVDTYLDGGTKIFESSDGKRYYKDGRLGSTTRGKIYDRYPNDKDATTLDVVLVELEAIDAEIVYNDIPTIVRARWVTSYKDGGTKVFKATDDKRYYQDKRLGSETKGKIYDRYPSDKGAKLLNVVIEEINE